MIKYIIKRYEPIGHKFVYDNISLFVILKYLHSYGEYIILHDYFEISKFKYELNKLLKK